MSTHTRPSTSPRPAPRRVEVSAELKDLMRRLKLGRLLDTLPERLALARTGHLPHHEFLEMLLADGRSIRTPFSNFAPRGRARPGAVR